MKRDISANLYQKCLILFSKILLMCSTIWSTVLLPWQHTQLQASPILKPFLATFGIPFWYLPMVPHMHDPEHKNMLAWIYGLVYSLSHKTVNTRENFWNVYCFLQPIRCEMKLQKITTKPPHWWVTSWRETKRWFLLLREILNFTGFKINSEIFLSWFRLW